MKLPCPHCTQILELPTEVIASFEGEAHFPCPVCGGRIAVPEITAPPARPKRKGRQTPILPKSGSEGRNAASKPSTERTPTSKSSKNAGSFISMYHGLNRNVRVLGAAVLILLGGLGIYLALTTKGDTHVTREERILDIIRNQFFTDLIASGATTKEELRGLWDIRPYGIGYVGVSNETRPWEQAEELAKRTGARVLRLDPPDAASRPPLLDWLAEVTTDLGGATLWLLDNGEPKVLHAPEVSRVSTMDRPRRVLLAWNGRVSN